MFDKVLLALGERERWILRARSNHDSKKSGSLLTRQIAYYDALMADMKRDLCRPGLATFMRTFL